MSALSLRSLRLWIGLAGTALFLVLLLANVDRGELTDSLRDVDARWLAASLPVYGGALWLRAARWRRILRPTAAIGARDAFSLVVIGYAANNVLPARAGELLRALLLHRRHGGSRSAALGTIVVERTLDGLVLALFLAATVALAGGSVPLRVLAVAGAVAFVAATVLLALLSHHATFAERLGERFGWVMRLLPARLRPTAGAALVGLLAGLTTLRGPRDWWAVGWLTTASWALEATSYWFVGLAFGLDLSPPIYLGLAGAANLAIAAPSTAGGVGPFEYFTREVAVAFGVGTATATAYALVLHALILVSVVLAGVVLAWRTQIGVASIVRAPAEEPTPEVEPASGGD